MYTKPEEDLRELATELAGEYGAELVTGRFGSLVFSWVARYDQAGFPVKREVEVEYNLHTRKIGEGEFSTKYHRNILNWRFPANKPEVIPSGFLDELKKRFPVSVSSIADS